MAAPEGFTPVEMDLGSLAFTARVTTFHDEAAARVKISGAVLLNGIAIFSQEPEPLYVDQRFPAVKAYADKMIESFARRLRETLRP
jgi:hypothetical protein